MLTVTEAASNHLAQILKRQEVPQDIAVRFIDTGEGIALEQDSEREGDTVFQHEGRTVLMLDPQVSELLAEGTLDLEGESLTLQHPEKDE